MRGNCIFSGTQFTSLRKRGSRMPRPRIDSRAWTYERDLPNSLAGTRVILMQLSFKLGFRDCLRYHPRNFSYYFRNGRRKRLGIGHEALMWEHFVMRGKSNYLTASSWKTRFLGGIPEDTYQGYCLFGLGAEYVPTVVTLCEGSELILRINIFPLSLY